MSNSLRNCSKFAMTNDKTVEGNSASNVSTSTSMILTTDDVVGSLAFVWQDLQDHQISLKHIQTRLSHKGENNTDILLIMDDTKREELEVKLIGKLKDKLHAVEIVPTEPNQGQNSIVNPSLNGISSDPWFPRHISDLDFISNNLVDIDADYNTTAPGWDDLSYRARRYEVIKEAKAYRYGQLLPHIDYRPEETATWRKVFETQTKLYPSHVCREYNSALKELREAGIYGPDRIPQLQEVSDFLKRRTGFTLRPVAGFLSPRDFLSGLAFRVFHATQYIRHHDKPFYTPEPDVCHDLLGHAPLFVDPDFAEFSQQLGLASLGASEEVIEKLSNVYWYTLEFGMCMEDGERKAFGAGLISGNGELPRCVQNDVKTLPFDADVAAVEKYIFNGFQHLYFVAQSFKDATKKFQEFANKFPRKKILRYNPLLSSVDLLDSKQSIARLIESSRNDMELATKALQNLNINS